MNAQERARYQARAKVLKAMAHPTRLFLVDELTENGPRCVCELTEMVGADMSTVSRHLATLKSAGIVEDERRGAQVHYRIRCECVSRFLDCVESVMQSNVESQRRLLASS